MAQNLVINGITYNGVESLSIAKSGGGVANFTDLSGDTVTPETLANGVTAHDKSGTKITGTMPIPVLETWVFELEDGTTVEKGVNVVD